MSCQDDDDDFGNLRTRGLCYPRFLGGDFSREIPEKVNRTQASFQRHQNFVFTRKTSPKKFD